LGRIRIDVAIGRYDGRSSHENAKTGGLGFGTLGSILLMLIVWSIKYGCKADEDTKGAAV